MSGFHLGGGGWVFAPLIYSRPFIKVAVVLFLRSNPSFYKTIVLPPLERFLNESPMYILLHEFISKNLAGLHTYSALLLKQWTRHQR